MNEQYEIVFDRVLKSLGGNKKTDKDGEFWIFEIGSTVLEIEPFVRSTGLQLSIGLDVSFSNPDLSRIVDAICGTKGQGRHPFRWSQFQQVVGTTEVVEGEVQLLMEKVLSVAKGVHLEELVDELANSQPEPRSMSQLMHLAALSLSGKTSILQDYLNGMRQGRRFGFVPMITPEFVERAKMTQPKK